MSEKQAENAGGGEQRYKTGGVGVNRKKGRMRDVTLTYRCVCQGLIREKMKGEMAEKMSEE